MGGQTSACVIQTLGTPKVYFFNRKQQFRTYTKSKPARLSSKDRRQIKDNLKNSDSSRF